MVIIDIIDIPVVIIIRYLLDSYYSYRYSSSDYYKVLDSYYSSTWNFKNKFENFEKFKKISPQGLGFGEKNPLILNYLLIGIMMYILDNIKGKDIVIILYYLHNIYIYIYIVLNISLIEVVLIIIIVIIIVVIVVVGIPSSNLQQ
jgi:hypothetical protein